MVDITKEGLFTLDFAIVHKAVFHCLPYAHPPPYKFLGVIYMSVCLSTWLLACLYLCLSACLSVCLMWWHERTIVILQGYMCSYILFFIHLTFIFGPFTSSFVFCPLCSKRFLCFIVFCLLRFNFQLFTFVFCV